MHKTRRWYRMLTVLLLSVFLFLGVSILPQLPSPFLTVERQLADSQASARLPASTPSQQILHPPHPKGTPQILRPPVRDVHCTTRVFSEPQFIQNSNPTPNVYASGVVYCDAQTTVQLTVTITQQLSGVTPVQRTMTAVEQTSPSWRLSGTSFSTGAPGSVGIPCKPGTTGVYVVHVAAASFHAVAPIPSATSAGVLVTCSSYRR